MLEAKTQPFNPKPLLERREGNKANVYKDSEGYLTAGIGHLLTESEKKQYKLGDTVPENIRDRWFEQDSFDATNAAIYQARELGIDDLRFIENLTSVNFQLGTNWNKEHKKTWSLMKSGNFDLAAKEAANSKWKSQTPVRVKDFQEALKKIEIPAWTYDIPRAR